MGIRAGLVMALVAIWMMNKSPGYWVSARIDQRRENEGNQFRIQVTFSYYNEKNLDSGWCSSPIRYFRKIRNRFSNFHEANSPLD